MLQALFKRLGILEGSEKGIGTSLSKVFGGGRKFASGTPYVTGPGTSTSDSIPAMLSVGEAIIPADIAQKNRGAIAAMFAGIRSTPFSRAAAIGSGIEGTRGSKTQINQKFVLALSESEVANAMMSSSGEKVVLHYIGKNRRALGF